MSHTIKKSLAGTSMEYFIVEGNEGLRVRKLSDSKLRIHIEKEAPEIYSRSRLSDGYEVPYWAMDVNTKALKEAISLCGNGGEAADVEEEQVTPKFKGIENTLAQITVEIGNLNEITISATASVKEFEKVKKEVSERKKKLNTYKQRLTSGMVAYREAQEFLA